MTKLNFKGVPNGYVVTPNILWRSGQPAEFAWQTLFGQGCRAVIDLNNTDDVVKKQLSLVEKNGMIYVSMPWDGFCVPKQAQIRAALSKIEELPKPVLVHCQHGSDRTGTLCACWRIHHDHWTWEKALEEAFIDLGIEGLHEGWMGIAVRTYGNHSEG